MKRFVSVLLIITLFLSTMPLDSVFSHTGYPPNNEIEFIPNEDNELQHAEFKTQATAGTTGVKFRTIGWNIKFSEKGSSTKYSVFLDVNIPNTSTEISYNIWLSKKGYDLDKSVNNRLDKSIEETITNATTKEAFRRVLENGGDFVFDARVCLVINGNERRDLCANTFDAALSLPVNNGYGQWGTNTKNELHEWYYERLGSSDPEPKAVNNVNADFKIIYKGNDITDNSSAAAVKDPENLQLILQDTSTASSAEDPITTYNWYYWNNGWTRLTASGGIIITDGGRKVTISNMDSGMPGSASLRKGFKLDVSTQSNIVDYSEHDGYFKLLYGSITTFYKDVETDNDLYPSELQDGLSYGTYTVNAKAAPANYRLLSASSKQVKIDVNNPEVKVYFYYQLLAADKGSIAVYYKDQDTNADIFPSETFVYDDYGTYSIEAQAAPLNYTLVTPSPQSVTISSAVPFKEITFFYKGAAAVVKMPPVAKIIAPDKVMAGDEFYVSGKESYDPDGYLVEPYKWDFDNDITGSSLDNKEAGYIWFDHENSGLIKLTVTDDDGLTHQASKRVDVMPPIPVAIDEITGPLKVNRKVSITAAPSRSPKHYPLDHSLTAWTFAAAPTDLKYSTPLAGRDINVLFKQAGTKNFSFSVENTAGFSNTLLDYFTIQPDLAPIPDFTVPSVVLRDPASANKAKITMTNTSYSNDGDTIGKAVAFYAYDSDNDSDYTDETWYYSKDGVNWLPVGLAYSLILTNFNIFTIATGNPSSFTLNTNQVGKYRFEIRVIEDIPDSQTIKSFLADSDYQKADTFNSKILSQKVVEVRNVAPTASFQAKKNVPADVTILTDYLGYKYDSLVSQVNVTKTGLLAANINPNVVYVGDRKSVGERTVYQYPWNRYIYVSVTGWAHNVYGNKPFNAGYTIPLETMTFFEGEENFPDRSKYTYQCGFSISEESPYDNGDPTWELYVYRYNYYNGQYQSTTTSKFRLGRGQQSNGLGTWFTEEQLNGLNITIDTTSYTQTFKKGDSSTGSERRVFQGLDVDKLKTVIMGSNNKYLLVAADSFWNTIETNKELKDYITANNISVYIVADPETREKVFSLTGFSDIRFINGSRAYEKDGKIYQYAGPLLQEITYTPRVIPTPKTSIDIPMNNYTSYRYKSDGEWESRTVLNQNYTTTISIVSGSVTVNSTVLNNVKTLYESEGHVYYIELQNGDVYYFKQSAWPYTSGSYYYKNTALSNPVLISGAKGIRNIKMINAQEYVDSGDIYNPKAVTTAEYHYIQDTNGNVFMGRRGGYYDKPYTSLKVDNSINFSHVASSVVDFNLSKSPVTKHFYDTWGNYRTYTDEVVSVEHALAGELSSILRIDLDVNIYSTKELLKLSSLYNGIRGGLYPAGDYVTALNDIANDIKRTTSSLSNYILVGETVDYTTFYADYENDPIYASRWWYDHNPLYFDSSLGTDANAGKYLATPLTSFSRPGKIDITFQNRDNPKADIRFDAYRLWSQVVDKLTLYVHRKPIALMDVNISQSGSTLSIVASDGGSYDLDHTSLANKGISQSEWSWRSESESSWHYERMNRSGLSSNTKYLIRLRVMDLEGAWSDYEVYTVSPGDIIVDASPKSVSWAKNDVTATIRGIVINGTLQNIKYRWTTTTAKPTSGWTTDARSSFATTQTANGVWYLHMEATSSSGGAFYRYRGPYQIDKTPPAVDCSPTSNTSESAFSLTVTASDAGGSGLKQVNYKLTNTTAKPSSGWNVSGSNSFVVPVNVDGTYYLHMEAFDNAGNSFYRYRGPFTYVSNRPPTVSLYNTPSFVYEGDTLRINVVPSDPDNNPLSVVLQEKVGAGSFTPVLNQSNVVSGSTVTYTRINVGVGTYQYSVVVTDSFGATAPAALTVTVHPLGVTGQVSHTDLWDEHRVDYNMSKSGSADSPRPYSAFFPGESFVLRAQTSSIDSQSSVFASQVSCSIVGSSFSTVLSDVGGNTWRGSLWDEQMMLWADQAVTFRFRAAYSNGTVKTQDVVVNIRDDEFWRQHLKF